MKKLALVLLLAGSLVALADDSSNLLQNGDFSSGIDHWEGDCHSFSSTDSNATPDFTASPASTPAAQGVYVKLRHDDWTKMSQDFDGKVGQYLLTVSYSFSPDTKLSTAPDDYANIPGANGFSLFPPFATTPGRWVVIISDLGAWRSSQYEVKPGAPGDTGTQTFTAPVRLNSDDEKKKGLFLLFPPGNGTVTVKNVSLVPQQAQ